MNKRIIGIDVARALSVIGMIIVNFKIVIGENGDNWLKNFVHLFDGKSAATFVVLAGIGLALMTNSAVRNQDQEKLKISRKRIVKRAVFLFVIGLSYISIWQADILHFYGIYMLLTLLFITGKSKQVLIGAVVLILIYPFLLLLCNYETGWNFTMLEYTDFWTFEGFLRNLFYNGFHPIIPWTAFMLVGLWFGRQDLNNKKFVKKTFLISLFAFMLIQFVSSASILIISEGNSKVIEDLTPILGTDPMPPMPIYMLNGIFIALAVISACIIIAGRFENSKIISALNKTGQLALTFYVAHVIIGIGVVETIDPSKLGNYSIEFSVGYALIFSLFCSLFAVIWLRHKKSGPLEWVMRKMTD